MRCLAIRKSKEPSVESPFQKLFVEEEKALFSPLLLRSRWPATGVSRALSVPGSVPESQCGGALWARSSRVSKKCSESVLEVPKKSPGHSGDSLETRFGHSRVQTPQGTLCWTPHIVGDTFGDGSILPLCKRTSKGSDRARNRNPGVRGVYGNKCQTTESTKIEWRWQERVFWRRGLFRTFHFPARLNLLT